jgi:hypothetical protein
MNITITVINLRAINKQEVVGILNTIYIKFLDVFSLLASYEFAGTPMDVLHDGCFQRIHAKQITTENVYEYNSEITFASNGAVIKSLPGNGPNFSRIQGQICHLVHTEDITILKHMLVKAEQYFRKPRREGYSPWSKDNINYHK